MQSITVLGSTGSIGVSTLDVIARHPDRYRIFALTAHRQIDKLLVQIRAHSPRIAVVGTAADAASLRATLRGEGLSTEVMSGPDALEQVSSVVDVDTVMAAIVGAAGLRPTLAAARAGKRILLANKEALVMSGQVFMSAVREGGASLLPIDSEHNAIFQALPDHYARDPEVHGVSRILLTASGGPFRKFEPAALARVTPEQACNHPNWVMGRKISVDSATMMNKGLEVIEAHWLFGAPAEMIQVVVHPQSVIHSMVQYIDGSVVAQLGNPDMRTPIAHALAFPWRIESGVAPLDLFSIAKLEFEPPDFDRFPCLALAYQALTSGGTAPAVLNAANEEAVSAFLDGQIDFLRIPRLIAAALEQIPASAVSSLDDVLAADLMAREFVTKQISA
ncbi:MAG: 1-deoxy-D-xylulose-5-phosphate reductoisomerase [Rhodocyclaceae bacterium]|nr:1-deoxy-D-xylulose-5-phosphate reductoisomerase [Rhodocyclaceae bacterium]MCB1898115.1 1-deoxy-D-xylulose-5-phosphate reductoisomerase [Rhodocyclaceae bacterium]MCP5308999.1 1-deoxy-D-xylulose-5-phosphate reductoisomerase [Zoogloeaceae bacterium]